jgi:hypothetical protein
MKVKNDPSLISINLLEYAAQLITMLGCHLHHLKSKDSWLDPHPAPCLPPRMQQHRQQIMAHQRVYHKCHRLRPCAPAGRPPPRPRHRLPLWRRRHKIECHCQRNLTHPVQIMSLSQICSAPCTGPSCLALGASSRMPPSSHRLWKSYRGPAARILSLPAGSY